LVEKGTQIILNNSKAIGQISYLIGAGSQGEIYNAIFQDKAYAAKIYFSTSNIDNQEQIISKLIQIRAPSDSFLWPIDSFYLQGCSFGYIMPLRESRFRSLNGLLKKSYDPTFQTLIQVSINLVNSFWLLHSQGLCYRDISLSNIFIDPNNGDIQICDNDNVFFDTHEQSDVFGTYRFMAPEIITGKSNPNTNTDLFSLSVLLFYIFYMHHPLEGQKEYEIHCFDEPAMKKLYGTHPIYIFDTDDDSNRPINNYQDNAILFHSIYPSFFKRIFSDAFMKGIFEPNKRIRETMWRKKLFQLRDSLFPCPWCNTENFYDPDSEKKYFCWHCKKEIRPDFVLHFDKHYFPLYLGKTIYSDFFKENTNSKTDDAIGIVVDHPSKPNTFGLKNLSDTAWIIFSSSGSSLSLAPGKTFMLKKGAKFMLYSKEGIII